MITEIYSISKKICCFNATNLSEDLRKNIKFRNEKRVYGRRHLYIGKKRTYQMVVIVDQHVGTAGNCIGKIFIGEKERK